MSIVQGMHIKIKRGGQTFNAEVLEKCDFGEDPIWWVKYGNEVTIFEEYLLKEWNEPRNCVCGAITVNHPGHAYYCDYNESIA